MSVPRLRLRVEWPDAKRFLLSISRRKQGQDRLGASHTARQPLARILRMYPVFFEETLCPQFLSFELSEGRRATTAPCCNQRSIRSNSSSDVPLSERNNHRSAARRFGFNSRGEQTVAENANFAELLRIRKFIRLPRNDWRPNGRDVRKCFLACSAYP
jgi:hypothetical protein